MWNVCLFVSIYQFPKQRWDFVLAPAQVAAEICWHNNIRLLIGFVVLSLAPLCRQHTDRDNNELLFAVMGWWCDAVVIKRKRLNVSSAISSEKCCFTRCRDSLVPSEPILKVWNGARHQSTAQTNRMDESLFFILHGKSLNSHFPVFYWRINTICIWWTHGGKKQSPDLWIEIYL